MQAIEKKEEVRTIGVREFLTFRLGHEEYGCDILKVQEIRGYEKPTRIANAPGFLKGVVNLRGTIVPIIDMRLKFNCAKADYNSFTVVIILNLRNGMALTNITGHIQTGVIGVLLIVSVLGPNIWERVRRG